MIVKHTFACLAFTLLVSLSSFAASPVEDRTMLLGGVKEIEVSGGVPGDITVFGARAFPVMAGRMGRSNLPVFAAASYGKGRAVAGGHEGFFNKDNLKKADNARFAVQIVRWGGQKPLAEVKVGLLDQDPALKEALEREGSHVQVLTANQLPGSLTGLDLLWLNQASLDGKQNLTRVAAVRHWVDSGDGLVITGPAWGWQMLHPSQQFDEKHSGNQLLLPMGLAFSSGMLDPTSSKGFIADEKTLAFTHAGSALNALEAQSKGTKPLSKDELQQTAATLNEAVFALPDDNNGFLTRVKRLIESQKQDQVLPTRQTPITLDQPLARLQMVMEMKSYRRMPASKVKANPSAASFPGKIPSDAPRVTRTVQLDANVPGWHGLGLYAAPGEVVTVSVSKEIASKGFALRIGGHTDTLWQLDRWERFPEVTLSRPLNATRVQVASPFGGTIYIVAPESGKLGEVSVTVSNAVAAPRFVRGVTPVSEWRQSIRNAPGPWAELEGKRVILTVPSEAVRNLDDPDALMTYWDEVMDRCFELYAAPQRDRPERYVVDRQISAGYMHAGYPIMTGDDVARTFTDVRLLRSKNGPVWGFYHEMGHNFQQSEWTWDSWGEVTNNLFSLYGNETINDTGIGAHPAMTAAEIEKRMQAVAKASGKEPYYSRDPWYPLAMLYLIRQEFGWKPFIQVFAEFRDLPKSERPKSELEKHDQFLQRFSKVTGRNLTGYLKAWGVEMSDEAQKSVESLPDWMPRDWPKVQAER